MFYLTQLTHWNEYKLDKENASQHTLLLPVISIHDILCCNSYKFWI